MNSTPTVSIIMAAKDTAAYLPDCLDSIIAQTFTDWELIVINDHSSDDTPQVLADYAAKDHRIKVFHSDRPKLIPSLKYGYPFISGELVNRMDSDDKMPIDKLETLVNEWRKYGKGYVIAGGTQHFVDEGEVGGGFIRYEQWLNQVAKQQRYLEEIYTECVIPSHCWLIHKEDLDQIGAFEPEVYPEDYDLCFRMYQAGLHIIGIDKVLHYWRDRSNRISRTWDEYKDNRYYPMKLHYFLKIDREDHRPLVLWGAGRNGKDLAKLLRSAGQSFSWVSDSTNKIGHSIYDVEVMAPTAIATMTQPQILIAVSSPSGKEEIKQALAHMNKWAIVDYWFFL
jgi:glycosyltransferase involved in cell wall biosynthesis